MKEIKITGKLGNIYSFHGDYDLKKGDTVYTHPKEPPQFPTMLRKMWSGSEVQEWINENWNKNDNRN